MDQPELNDKTIKKVLDIAEDLGEGTEHLSEEMIVVEAFGLPEAGKSVQRIDLDKVTSIKVKKQLNKPFCPVCKDESPIETVLEKKVAILIKIGEDEKVYKLSLFICSKCKSYFVW